MTWATKNSKVFYLFIYFFSFSASYRVSSRPLSSCLVIPVVLIALVSHPPNQSKYCARHSVFKISKPKLL